MKYENIEENEIKIALDKLSTEYQIKRKHIRMRGINIERMEMEFFVPGVGPVVMEWGTDSARA